MINIFSHAKPSDFKDLNLHDFECIQRNINKYGPELKKLCPKIRFLIIGVKELCHKFSIPISENPDCFVDLYQNLSNEDDFQFNAIAREIGRILGLSHPEHQEGPPNFHPPVEGACEELNKLKNTLKMHLDALDNSAIVQEVDAKGFILYANQLTGDTTGYPLDHIIGMHTSKMNSGYHPPEFWIDLWRTVTSGNVWNGEIRNKRRDGSFYWSNTTITPFIEDGKVVKFIVIRFDTTELHDQRITLNRLAEELERKNRILEELALTDGLTGLANRRSFDLKLEEEIEKKNTTKYKFSLALIDIDHFKKFNDEYGHPEGDSILTKLGDLAKKYFGNSIFFSRYGGEEFAVIFEQSSSEVAFSIIEAFRKEVEAELSTSEYKITISVGLTEIKKDDVYASILRRADQALYKAKKTGRNNVQIK